MNTELKTPHQLFNDMLVILSKEAVKNEYSEKESILIEELIETGHKYALKWLADSEFYMTFKGNMVGYYLGICVNCLCGGMEYADAWADGGSKIADIKYDEIYDGGVWNNVFVLLEMKNDNSKKDFQNFIIAMYEKWVLLLKDYFKTDRANEYIASSVAAFFQLGVTLRLDILGY